MKKIGLTEYLSSRCDLIQSVEHKLKMTPLGYCMGFMLYVGFQFQSQASRIMALDNLYSLPGYDQLAVWVGILHLENH